MKSYRLKEGLSRSRAKLRVREAPNFDSKVIYVLEQGETMRMRKLGHDWMLVSLDDEASQGFCKFSENNQQLLEEVEDEERELMRNQAISPLRASVDNIVVVQRSSPGGSTTSDSVSSSLIPNASRRDS